MLAPKGLKGGVRVEVLTDWPERLDAGSDVWPDGDDRPMRIVYAETGGRVPVLYLEGVETREAAEAMVGRYLEAPQRDLEPGTYFWEDLIGLRVESPDGGLVGELVEIFRAGANEVYRIVGPDGERLVPALRSAVSRIDLDAGVMVVAPDDSEEVR